MKKLFYILGFGFLGLLVATLLHAVIEMIALNVIFTNPEKYYTTFWWQEWEFVHALVSAVLWWAGLGLGLYAGFHYWKIVYIEGRHWRARKRASLE